MGVLGGTDIDNACWSARLQGLEQQLGEQERRQVIEGQCRFQAAGGECATGISTTSMVHQQVQVVMGVLKFAHQLAHVFKSFQESSIVPCACMQRRFSSLLRLPNKTAKQKRDMLAECALKSAGIIRSNFAARFSVIVATSPATTAGSIGVTVCHLPRCNSSA